MVLKMTVVKTSGLIGWLLEQKKKFPGEIIAYWKKDGFWEIIEHSSDEKTLISKLRTKQKDMTCLKTERIYFEAPEESFQWRIYAEN